MKPHISPHVDQQKKTIEFYVHKDYCSHVSLKGVSKVSLAGSFNDWAQHELEMQPDEGGFWVIEIPLLPEGRYTYKFLVDDKLWVEDLDNPNREPDGTAGFKSVLLV